MKNRTTIFFDPKNGHPELIVPLFGSKNGHVKRHNPFFDLKNGYAKWQKRFSERCFWRMFLRYLFRGSIFLCHKTKALRTCGKNPECKTEKVFLRMFIHPRHHAWPRLTRTNSRGKRAWSKKCRNRRWIKIPGCHLRKSVQSASKGWTKKRSMKWYGCVAWRFCCAGPAQCQAKGSSAWRENYPAAFVP